MVNENYHKGILLYSQLYASEELDIIKQKVKKHDNNKRTSTNIRNTKDQKHR